MANHIIVWFRNDLRVHDHEALYKAVQNAQTVLPVYIIDPRHFGETRFGFPRTGSFRARFLIQSLADLRRQLQALGSDLIILRGKPEALLPKLALETGARAVYLHREVGTEESRVEESVEQALTKNGVEYVDFWGASLVHLADLPFPVKQLPEVFTDFRKELESDWQVREPFPVPETVPFVATQPPGELPTLTEWNLSAPPSDSRSLMEYKGGEVAGLQRLTQYIWGAEALAHYKETRNGLMELDDSSKLSAWLALGNLSPRKVYQEVRKFESEVVANKSTYWLIFELLWRDYFRFWLMKVDAQAFQEAGIQSPARFQPGEEDWERFHSWTAGETGIPFVDAHMRELKNTGFMSNRGRQNVASYLVRDLKLNWLMGAEWFESLLIDYDVCSNYGNWAYVAGVGADPRGDRYFNVLTQADRYDPDGAYVRKWCPELQGVPGDKIHQPFAFHPKDQQSWGVEPGVDYPHPLALPRNWSK